MQYSKYESPILCTISQHQQLRLTLQEHFTKLKDILYLLTDRPRKRIYKFYQNNRQSPFDKLLSFCNEWLIKCWFLRIFRGSGPQRSNLQIKLFFVHSFIICSKMLSDTNKSFYCIHHYFLWDRINPFKPTVLYKVRFFQVS